MNAFLILSIFFLTSQTLATGKKYSDSDVKDTTYRYNKWGENHWTQDVKLLYPNKGNYKFFIPPNDSKKCSYSCKAYTSTTPAGMLFTSDLGNGDTNTCQKMLHVKTFCNNFVHTIPTDFYDKDTFCYEIGKFPKWLGDDFLLKVKIDKIMPTVKNGVTLSVPGDVKYGLSKHRICKPLPDEELKEMKQDENVSISTKAGDASKTQGGKRVLQSSKGYSSRDYYKNKDKWGYKDGGKERYWYINFYKGKANDVPSFQ